MPTRARSPNVKDIAQEPFRIFFPIGLALGVAGVALWPAYYGRVLSWYPGTSHARLMIEGFMASFVIGFLGTAGPRITSSFPFSIAELLLLLTCDALAAGLHFGGANRAGDIVFVLLLFIFAIVLARRFAARRDWPPPNFTLVALGILNGAIGASLLAMNENAVYSLGYRLGAVMLEQGFVLLPVLGVAPFFIRRLLDIEMPEQLLEGRSMPPRWLRDAALAIAIGLTIIATFIAEAIGQTTAAAAVRTLLVAGFLLGSMPRVRHTFLANCLRVALVSFALGYAIEAFVPLARVAALHVVFISGFSFIVMTVATRVVLGHSGRRDLLERGMRFFVVVAVLGFLAAMSRYVADVVPNARTLHLVAAAICWLTGAVIWGAKVLPHVRSTDAGG